MIKVDLTHAQVDVSGIDVSTAHKRLRDISVANSNVWVETPSKITDAEIDRILKIAKEVRTNFDVLFVVGVGGSYAGPFSVYQWFGADFPVEFLGTSFDPTVTQRALAKWKGKRICVNGISKSGTTLETTTTIEAVKPFVKKIYMTLGEKFKERDFTIPEGVGGRFSARDVMYFPLAVAGVDIKRMHDGARAAYKDLQSPYDNEAYKYAIARNKLHPRKAVELFASFYDGLEGLGRWWQQLFGESEGKEGKGLMPVPLTYSRDLHSMGQFVQQGSRIFFETILNVQNPPKTTPPQAVPPFTSEEELLNTVAFKGTVKAHSDAGVPVVVINIERLDAYGFGYMFYFFEIACAMSALLLGVNPFDQPGVEFYKREMRAVLGDALSASLRGAK